MEGGEGKGADVEGGEGKESDVEGRERKRSRGGGREGGVNVFSHVAGLLCP